MPLFSGQIIHGKGVDMEKIALAFAFFSLGFSATSARSQKISGANIKGEQTSLTLSAGHRVYLYGMTDGGGYIATTLQERRRLRNCGSVSFQSLSWSLSIPIYGAFCDAYDVCDVRGAGAHFRQPSQTLLAREQEQRQTRASATSSSESPYFGASAGPRVL
jgi:hypothetical protein